MKPGGRPPKREPLPELMHVPRGFQNDAVRERFEQEIAETVAFLDELIARGADGAYIVKALSLPRGFRPPMRPP